MFYIVMISMISCSFLTILSITLLHTCLELYTIIINTQDRRKLITCKNVQFIFMREGKRLSSVIQKFCFVFTSPREIYFNVIIIVIYRILLFSVFLSLTHVPFSAVFLNPNISQQCRVKSSPVTWPNYTHPTLIPSKFTQFT